MSENQEFRITTGAHSLSSTDSDMAKAVHKASNVQQLDSPPDLISPKSGLLFNRPIEEGDAAAGDSNQPLLVVEDDQQEMDGLNNLVEDIAGSIYAQMLSDVEQDLHVLVPRPSLLLQRQMPAIRPVQVPASSNECCVATSSNRYSRPVSTFFVETRQDQTPCSPGRSMSRRRDR